MMFTINKQVIAINNHPDGCYRKGDIYTLLAMRISMCRCGVILLHIGQYVSENSGLACDRCYVIADAKDGIFWHTASDFVPYDNSLSETTIDQLIYELTGHYQD
jgi:hypothetical protein